MTSAIQPWRILLIEVTTMRRFAGIDLISDRIPDETTILAFRHLLEKHDLGKQILETMKAHLKANGMAMKQGTIIDATLIAAPSSTLTEAAGRAWRSSRTRHGSGIPRCIRPRRATIAISGWKSTSAWTRTLG